MSFHKGRLELWRESGNLRNEQHRVAACRNIVGNFLVTLKETLNATLMAGFVLCKNK